MVLKINDTADDKSSYSLFYLSSIRWGMFGTFSCCVYCCCQELFFPSFVSCLTTPFSLALFTIQHDLSYLIAYITKATSIVLFYLKKRLTVIRELTYQLYKAWSIRIGISISRSPWQEIGTRYRQQKKLIYNYIYNYIIEEYFIYLFIYFYNRFWLSCSTDSAAPHL